VSSSPAAASAGCRASAELPALLAVVEQREEVEELRDRSEGNGVQATLNAAAWTYVVAALIAVTQLLYFLSLLNNR